MASDALHGENAPAAVLAPGSGSWSGIKYGEAADLPGGSGATRPVPCASMALGMRREWPGSAGYLLCGASISRADAQQQVPLSSFRHLNKEALTEQLRGAEARFNAGEITRTSVEQARARLKVLNDRLTTAAEAIPFRPRSVG